LLSSRTTCNIAKQSSGPGMRDPSPPSVSIIVGGHPIPSFPFTIFSAVQFSQFTLFEEKLMVTDLQVKTAMGSTIQENRYSAYESYPGSAWMARTSGGDTRVTGFRDLWSARRICSSRGVPSKAPFSTLQDPFSFYIPVSDLIRGRPLKTSESECRASRLSSSYRCGAVRIP